MGPTRAAAARVGIVAGPRHWLVTDARIAGHLAALADVGVLSPAGLTRHVPEPTTEHGYRAAGELLDLPDRPTALVGFNDKMAVGALRAATERGLRVPLEMSIAGFDDSDLSRATHPELTTVRSRSPRWAVWRSPSSPASWTGTNTRPCT